MPVRFPLENRSFTKSLSGPIIILAKANMNEQPMVSSEMGSTPQG